MAHSPREERGPPSSPRGSGCSSGRPGRLPSAPCSLSSQVQDTALVERLPPILRGQQTDCDRVSGLRAREHEAPRRARNRPSLALKNGRPNDRRRARRLRRRGLRWTRCRRGFRQTSR